MSKLQNLLIRENTLILRFLDVLEEEKIALIANQPDLLESIGASKLNLVEQLNELEANRANLIDAPSGTNTKEAMQRWLSTQPEHQTISATLWSETLALAQQAKELHMQNSELLSLRLSNTEEALDILFRRQKEAGLYGKDGQAASSSGSRIIDSA